MLYKICFFAWCFIVLPLIATQGTEEMFGLLNNSIKWCTYFIETEMQQECLATQGKKFPTCSFCKKTGFDGRHMLYRCVEFIGLTPVKRLEQLKLMKRCFNCLSSGHSTLSDCPSKFRCRECNKPHHTLLHFDLPSRKPAD